MPLAEARAAQQTRAFMFTDLVGSTAAWQADPEAMAAGLSSHDMIFNSVFDTHGGELIKHTGDGMLASFPTVEAALAASLEGQTRIREVNWGGAGRRAVRIAIHVGPAYSRDGDWFGPTLNRTARVLGVIDGDQVVITSGAAEQLPATATNLADLGHHHLRDIPQPERLYAVAADGLSVAPPSDSGSGRSPLPRLRTAVLGRQEALAELAGDLAEAPLVTVVGPGGVGKTTLAVAAARGAETEQGELTAFADLAELSEPGDVPRVIAEALGVPLDDLPENTERAILERIAGSVGDSRILLVVDNCEHVIDACRSVLDGLVDGCPTLTVLATSREPLEVDGELVRRLPPLDTSPEGPAVELFLARMRTAGGDAELTPQQRQAVARLCEHLDGLPLGVELAAAQAARLPLEEIARRLEEDLAALSTGKGRHRRQQTLEATIGWSHDLLDPLEQMLLRRLSVCAGNFDLTDAVAIAAFGDLGEGEVRTALTALVDRSLVVADDLWSSLPYRLLETVRAFGRGRLESTGEIDETLTRHADHHLRRIAGIVPEWTAVSFGGPEPGAITREIVNRDADMRSAIDHAKAIEDHELLAEAFPAISAHAVGSAWDDEAVDVFAFLEDWLADQPAETRQRVYWSHLIAQTIAGTTDQGSDLAQRIANLQDEDGDPAQRLGARGIASWRNPADDPVHTEVADQIAEAVPFPPQTQIHAHVHQVRGVLLFNADRLPEAIDVIENAGPRAFFSSLSSAAAAYLALGDVDAAARTMDGWETEPDFWWSRFSGEMMTVAVTASQGRRAEALELLEALHKQASTRPPSLAHSGLAAVAAWVAMADSDHAAASRLLGSIPPPGDPYNPADAILSRATIRALRKALPAEERKRLRAEGQAMSRLDAVRGYSDEAGANPESPVPGREADRQWS